MQKEELYCSLRCNRKKKKNPQKKIDFLNFRIIQHSVGYLLSQLQQPTRGLAWIVSLLWITQLTNKATVQSGQTGNHQSQSSDYVHAVRNVLSIEPKCLCVSEQSFHWPGQLYSQGDHQSACKELLLSFNRQLKWVHYSSLGAPGGDWGELQMTSMERSQTSGG